MDIGYKLYKLNMTNEQAKEMEDFCNNTQQGHIEDKGDYYEVVENAPTEEFPIVASQLDRIEAQVMYTALLTDTLIESEVE